MNIVIIGCGKMSSRLANKLSDLGFDVSVVDGDKNSFELLDEGFTGFCVKGNEMDIDVLKNAGCDNADIAVVATKNDNKNITVARILESEFGVRDVYVRLLDPSRESVFRKFGLNTVCSTRLEGDIFLSRIIDKSDNIESVTVDDTSIHFYSEKADRKQQGKKISEVVCHKNTCIVAVRSSDGSVHMASQEDFIISDGDKIIYAMI